MADRCTCRVESCGCVMTSGCKLHGQRIEPPSSKGPCGCDESVALKARVAELEAGIRDAQIAIATSDTDWVTSLNIIALKLGKLLEASNG